MQLPVHTVPSTSTRSASRPAAGGRTFYCLLLVVAAAAHTSPLRAQPAQELDYLLFDPVPLAAQPAPDGSTQFTELAPPPQGQPLELQQWLAANLPESQISSETPEESIRRQEQLVQEIEINEGPFSPRLPQQLQALGTALQASGDYEAAQKHFEQAMYVTRVNHGLFSDTQIPFVQQSINNQLRQGKLFAADEQQRYLFYLNQKNHGDDSAALLPALEDFAEWNIFAFNAPVTMPALSPEGEAVEASAVDEAMFRVERLINAQHIYWSIAQILVANFGMSDPRLLDAEKRIAMTNYFFATTIATDAETLNLGTANLPTTPTATGLAPAPLLGNMGYRQGREALERRISYMQEMEQVAPEDLLRANLDLADWMLYFSRQRMKGIELYEQLHADFAQTLAPETLDAVLSPAYPEQLPSFIKPAWSRAALGLPQDQALQYKGHIDVEFALNRFGKTTTVKVLDRSDPEAKLVEQRLLRSLRRAQFRPRFHDGQLRLDDTLQVRYYYTW